MRTISLISFVFTSLFLLLVSPAQAAVLVNEISPSTDSEWIELFNDSDTSVDLSGFLLEDGNSSHSDDINLNGIISGKGYLVFTHNEGWLNNGGDTVKLYNNATPSAIIDQYTYGSVNSTSSVIRSPDGGENWVVTNNVSKGFSNPSPTPSSTSTPNPTTTSTPTLTPISTKTPTPTPTKTPTPKPSPTSIPTDSPTPEVLGESTIAPTPTDNQETLVEGKVINKPPVLAFILVFVGVLLMGISGFLSFKKMKESGPQNEL